MCSKALFTGIDEGTLGRRNDDKIHLINPARASVTKIVNQRWPRQDP